MELSGIDLVLKLGWLHIVDQLAEVTLAELGLLVSLESLVKRRLLALVVLSVDGGACSLGEGFSEEVLRFDLRHVTGISWDVLSLKVLGGTSKPVIALFRIVTESNGSTILVNGGRFRVVLAVGI